MKIFRLEVFDRNGSNPRMRWWQWDPQHTVERGLDAAELDGLITRAAKADGAATSSTSSVFTATGTDLYRWVDGSTERWLANARAAEEPLVVYVEADEQLRSLPWELLYDNGFLAVDPSRPVAPVRAGSNRERAPRVLPNRPLRVLFVASSPLTVEPVLDFEGEEATILNASGGRVEVVVEESGSLTGLAATLQWFGEGHFDVLHLSGHALIGHNGPRFVMEDDEGRRADASASDIAAAIGDIWPGLVFVSGCSTAGASSAGQVASMAEALVAAGAPAVLGWALPVGDISASDLAAILYRQLGTGEGVVKSVTDARRSLFAAQSRYWHLLRIYADRSPLGPLVTRMGTKGRARLRVHEASTLFLDQEGRVKVASRQGFVGRRRELQRLLRELRPSDSATGPKIAKIHGIGGLGKSTLTARLLDRLRTTHEHHAVWVGKVDQTSITTMAQQLRLDPDTEQEVGALLAKPAPLSVRIRWILDGPVADKACTFVFDDFESNLEPDGQGGYLCERQALEVLTAFGTAIEQTASASRVLVTSRYNFPLPSTIGMVSLSLAELQGNDLDKKVRLLPNLGPTSLIDPDLRQRAVAAGAGIPRLLERLDTLLSTGTAEDMLTSIESVAVGYRDELLLKQLLSSQPASVRRAVVTASVYTIAVPLDAVIGLSSEQTMSRDLEHAVAVGLVQAGLHPTTGEKRYLVSPLVRPLLDDIEPPRLWWRV